MNIWVLAEPVVEPFLGGSFNRPGSQLARRICPYARAAIK
jgi:hypothetical protein